MLKVTVLTVLCFLGATGDPQEGARYAKCGLYSPDKSSSVTGTVYFAQESSGSLLQIHVAATGLDPTDNVAKHGFHVHEKGIIEGSCLTTGGHFNPYNMNHGAPTASVRHVGDLGNVLEEDGAVVASFTDDLASLFVDPRVIMNRAMVLHAGEDDLGLVDNEGSRTTGNAGARLACCVIIPATKEEYDAATA